MNETVVVADTSCLIILDRIGELSLLQKLFSNVMITREVANEFGDVVPDWIKVEFSENLEQPDSLRGQLDSGEAGSILLAIEKSALLIIDEKKGRRIAQSLGVRIIGTLGLVLFAKKRGLIDSVAPLIAAIEREGFFISTTLIEELFSDE